MGNKIGVVGAAILAAAVGTEHADATSSASIEVERLVRQVMEAPVPVRAEIRPLAHRTPKFIRGPVGDDPPPPPPPSMRE